jgi:aldose 1-epimerase
MSTESGAAGGAPGHSHPSGQQYEITSGGQAALLTEVGGALREYRLDGRPLNDGSWWLVGN